MKHMIRLVMELIESLIRRSEIEIRHGQFATPIRIKFWVEKKKGD